MHVKTALCIGNSGTLISTNEFVNTTHIIIYTYVIIIALYVFMVNVISGHYY